MSRIDLDEVVKRSDAALDPSPEEDELDDIEIETRRWKSAKDVPALVAELRLARQFRDDIAAALAPGRWRGFDGPDGVSTHEVVDDVAAALAHYDRHAERGECDG